jgi:nucleoside-diphosphate-sugar epimerase
MNILITGSNGFIGTSIKKYLSAYNNIIIKAISRLDFDLSCYESTKKWFIDNNKYYDIVIHTAIKGGSRLKNDDCDTIDNNIKMYYNLLSNNLYFNKFINLSSGAEYCQQHTPYGLSKKIISESIKCKTNYFNLRIYAVFNEHELDSRFIKNNILNYINNSDITIFKNKLMDFMYMKDFLSIVYEYINHNNLPKDIDCVYQNKYTLLDIAKIINNLETKKVKITINNETLDDSYVGKYTNIGLDFIGLEQGIKHTYNSMKALL